MVGLGRDLETLKAKSLGVPIDVVVFGDLGEKLRMGNLWWIKKRWLEMPGLCFGFGWDLEEGLKV